MTRPLAGLDTLLELDGSVFEQEAGFWIKIEAKQVNIPYEFETPQQLLEDFFAETDRVIQARKEQG